MKEAANKRNFENNYSKRNRAITMVIQLIKIFLFPVLLSLHIALSQQNIPYNLISSGGQKTANSSLIIISSIGEAFTGKSINTVNQINAGFWSVYRSEVVLSVKDNYNLPMEFILEQNYPNPFNPGTTIQFYLPKQTQLKINLYNILGEKVIVIAEGLYEASYHKLTFNAGNLPSGAYIYRLESNEFVSTK